MECGGTMTNVLVLGASGMLGSMVTRYLSEQEDLRVVGTTRDFHFREQMPTKSGWRYFDADNRVDSYKETFDGADWIINCIGVIKPKIDEKNSYSIENSIKTNSLFPHKLARNTDIKIVSILTDCVYTGLTGNYTESSPHDALDVYGKTKSLGEVTAPNVCNLRCSIIGPEKGTQYSLLEWFLHQQKDAVINGYTNHLWNGITTHAFAKICYGIINNGVFPLMQHIVPANTTHKDTLLRDIAFTYCREDVRINSVEATVAVNRTLKTEETYHNKLLWELAGYKHIPTIPMLLAEMREYTC